jgi:uncharacterized protein YndB with AHSA1/START domain
MLRTTIFALLILAFAAPLPLGADVADQAPNGFTVKISTVVRAVPEEVYSKLVHNVGDWWSPDHTFSNDSHNLTLDDKVMGCFCEKLPNGGGVRHAEVVMVMPNKLLVMDGALGPLQQMGAKGTLTIVLEPMHKDTRVRIIYAVGGYLPDGLNTWAAPVDKVLTEQLMRLRAYVETGNPNPPAAEKKP